MDSSTGLSVAGKRPDVLCIRRSSAFVISAAMHLIILVFMMHEANDHPLGNEGNDMGTGFQISLVQGFSSGQPSKALADIEKDVGEPDKSEMRGGDEEKAMLTTKPSDQAPEVKYLPTLSEGRNGGGASTKRLSHGETSGKDEGAFAARAATGGDPMAFGNILSQIARCLPPNFRPSLSFSRLVLAIGDDGALTAAPSLASTLPLITTTETAAADKIVQAALQCGPYRQPNFKNRVISFVADFSAIQPTVASSGSVNASPSARETTKE